MAIARVGAAYGYASLGTERICVEGARYARASAAPARSSFRSVKIFLTGKISKEHGPQIAPPNPAASSRLTNKFERAAFIPVAVKTAD